YDTEELKKRSLEVVEKNDLVFLADVISFLPCSKQTFYNHDLDEFDKLKEIIENNRISKKRELRKKWFDSKNATLQLALMKLLTNRDELNRLNNNKDDEKLDEINRKLSEAIPNYFE